MNIYKQNSEISFDKQAKTYDYDYHGNHARKLYPFILEEIKVFQPETVLDIGCGTGELINQIITRYDDTKVSGIDLSKKMLDIAKNKLTTKVDLRQGDAEYLPYPNESFDFIYCNDSFHHYPNPQAVIHEVHRVLKKNGVFVIGDCYQPIFTRTIMNWFFKFGKDGDVKIYSKKEFNDLLGTCFTNKYWRKVNARSCLVVGIKE